MRKARDVPDSHQETLLKGMTARYDNAVELTVMYPGVLAALIDKNPPVGCCTNKLYRPAMAVLRHLKIDHLFTTVWGGDNPLARKRAGSLAGCF